MLLRTVAKSTPATLAVGSKQYAYLFQGNGTRPTRIDLNGAGVPEVVDMGMDAPTVAPSIEMTGDPEYYVARFDVIEGGAGFNKAPSVTLSGGDPEKPAVARAYLSGVSLGDVEATQNGRGYKSTPTVTINGGVAGGATLTATLVDDTSFLGPTRTSTTGAMATFKVLSEPTSGVCLPALKASGFNDWLDFISNSAGSTWNFTDAAGNIWSPTYEGFHARGAPITYRVQGPDRLNFSGTAFTVDITFSSVTRAINGVEYDFPARFQSLSWFDRGSKYTGPVIISRPKLTLPPGDKEPTVLDCGISGASGGLSIQLTPEPGGGTVTPPVVNPGTPRAIKSVAVVSGGTGFTTPPAIKVDDAYGYGAELQAVLTDGKITEVKVLKGGLYTQAPSLSTNATGAKAVAITRAHIRGRYDCYYRYLDDTPAGRGLPEGQPIPSSLSPVTTIDAGDGVGQLEWTITPPASTNTRAKKVELWRTTSDEAYTVYRVATLNVGTRTFTEDFTDLELQDFDRDGYAAMPVLLPNGELNANRFGVPPSDKAVAVMFQDRLWMAVDTSGTSPNTIRFSEYNEPESCPDVNELSLQTNVKGNDRITALIPYGASLGVMQARHAYRLSYVSQPLLDANLQVSSYRGCLNQRCWDEFEGLVYCMDTQGVYAMDQGGQVQPLSLGIRNLFEDKIDFSKDDWFSVTTDHRSRCLRVAVRFKEDALQGAAGLGPSGKYPTRFFCYSFDAQGWWEERYPAPLVGSATIRDLYGASHCVYGSNDGNIYEVNSGDSDQSDGSVKSITLKNAGSKYIKTPRVTITGDGTGAVAEAAVAGDGTLLGVYLRFGGYGYTRASVTIDPPPTGGTTATADATVGSDDPLPVSCWFKSGNMEYPHDTLPVEMKDSNRNVAMLFTPTSGPCQVKLRMYYNNNPHPRVNVAARDRGTGAVYETQEPCVTLDLNANLLPDRISTGVCRALFSSHTVDDIRGNDRHVAIELSSQAVSGPVEIHSVDVFGTPGA